ncbi:MAG: hypothetical protein PHY34_03070 [Patescibacteria group bacterium]|nr:hypothetical protein [Patescibacteria group bacterium]MDD5716143.1 hypothetical protein [Patescibacteria group bacterium]
MDTQPKKSFFKRFWWVLVLIVLIAVLAVGFVLKDKFKPDTVNLAEMADDKFITANPVDLTQILAISRFRSCAGHWYGATSLQGEPEASSSLKHYFVPQEEFSPSDNQVNVFSPFDGVIESIEYSGRGNHLTLVPNEADSWQLTIFHVKNLESMVEGQQVTAGELLGYAVFSERGDDFDISLKARTENFYQNIDSIFNHFSGNVLSGYSATGASVQEMIIDKQVRAQSPCTCKDGQPNTTYCNFPTDYLDPVHYFTLEQ